MGKGFQVIHVLHTYAMQLVPSIRCYVVISLRDGFPKKSSCSFGFCPNSLDPPPPNLDNLYHFFWTPKCQKIWAGVNPSLPILKLTFLALKKVVKVVQIWGKGAKVSWTKSKWTATFFHETFPKTPKFLHNCDIGNPKTGQNLFAYFCRQLCSCALCSAISPS